MDSIRFGIIMDPIGDISPAKDSSLAMSLEIQRRGHSVSYFEQADLYLADGVACGSARALTVADDADSWYQLGARAEKQLGEFDVILMRKDPPFDTEYIYTTYILERAEQSGTLIINRPASLRDINEKVFTAWFPDLCPGTLITRSMEAMRRFLHEAGTIVVNPLHGMGGKSIFVVSSGDKNANVIFETLTENGSRYAMAQHFVPEITAGDKRIILIDGRPAPCALARIPAMDDYRGNLVAGAQPEIRELTARDREICAAVGPVLRDRGVIFAGIDVIGDYLTEVNVTSPTGIREIARYGEVDLAAKLLEVIERQVAASRHSR